MQDLCILMPTGSIPPCTYYNSKQSVRHFSAALPTQEILQPEFSIKKKNLKQDQNSRFDEHIFLLHTVSNYCLLLLPGNQANILLIPGVLIHNLEESPTRYKCVWGNCAVVNSVILP